MHQTDLRGPVTVNHDTIPHRWDAVPRAKYENWRRMYKWAARLDRVLDTETWRAPGYPYSMQVEVSSLCNLKCPACVTGQGKLGRPGQNMELGNYQTLVDSVQEYLLVLVMWNWGEPFMNPELPAMVRYATERDIKTVTSTNSHFLKDKQYLEELLNSGLSALILAVDTFDADKYEVYRRGGDLDQARAGVKAAVEAKRRTGARTQINLRAVAMRHNEDDLGRMRKVARDLGVDIFSVKTLSPACGDSELDAELVPLDPRKRRYRYAPGTWERIRRLDMCIRTWTMTNVLANGDVVPCCTDYAGEMVLGNAFETPLPEIWTGEAYARMRQRVHTDPMSFEPCRRCVVQFETTDCPWFVESTNFRSSWPSRAKASAKKFIYRGAARRAIDLARLRTPWLFP